MNSTFSNNLRKYREKHNLIQEQVATIIKTTQRAYSFYETGRSEPDIDRLIMLSKLYGVPIDVLVGIYNINE